MKIMEKVNHQHLAYPGLLNHDISCGRKKGNSKIVDVGGGHFAYNRVELQCASNCGVNIKKRNDGYPLRELFWSQ